MGVLTMRALLKSAKTICGDSFLLPVGALKMLKSYAINLDTPMEVSCKLTN